MKGLSRGRRVHRGHRDMPPARPPVVTEAPLSPWRALRRGEDPPPPPPAAGAQRFTHILSQKHVGSRAASVPGAAEEDGAVAAESQGRRRPQGARPETLRGAVWRWSHANPVWSRTDPRGFQRKTGKFVKSAFPETSGRGGFRSSALSTPFKSVRDKSKSEL